MAARSRPPWGLAAGPLVLSVGRFVTVPWQSMHWISMAARTSP
jgi:hypothetical protein